MVFADAGFGADVFEDFATGLREFVLVELTGMQAPGRYADLASSAASVSKLAATPCSIGDSSTASRIAFDA